MKYKRYPHTTKMKNYNKRARFLKKKKKFFFRKIPKKVYKIDQNRFSILFKKTKSLVCLKMF